jgi:hypothetical protein
LATPWRAGTPNCWGLVRKCTDRLPPNRVSSGSAAQSERLALNPQLEASTTSPVGVPFGRLGNSRLRSVRRLVWMSSTCPTRQRPVPFSNSYRLFMFQEAPVGPPRKSRIHILFSPRNLPFRGIWRPLGPVYVRYGQSPVCLFHPISKDFPCSYAVSWLWSCAVSVRWGHKIATRSGPLLPTGTLSGPVNSRAFGVLPRPHSFASLDPGQRFPLDVAFRSTAWRRSIGGA